MARWLLDTNIVSQAARNPHGALARRIAAMAEEELCTSIVVVGEIRFGLAKAASERLTASVAAVLGGLTIEPLNPPSDVHHGDVRARLEKRGRPMGANDLWIAAHALALGCGVVTDDSSFQDVDGLIVENWLRDADGQ